MWFEVKVYEDSKAQVRATDQNLFDFFQFSGNSVKSKE